MILRAVKVFGLLTVVTGGVYPLLIGAIAKVGFSEKAGGSLVFKQGVPVGSELIAQKFEKPDYFHPRPSAVDYNPLPSGGSNLGPTSQTLYKQIEERKKKGASLDLLTASGSGLDPHISPESARSQITRILQSREGQGRVSEKLTQDVEYLIEQSTQGPQWWILGEKRVNVLKLNLSLDERMMQETRKEER